MKKLYFQMMKSSYKVKSNYNLITKDIEHEDRGSANIFYITDDENEKYVFKEFESRCKGRKNIKKEARIVDFLKIKKYKCSRICENS